jgi:hypothetical protein
VRLHNKYQKNGFQAVFVTYIEGNKEGKDMELKDELAFDRNHWYVEDTIAPSMRVAVVDPPLKAGADTLKGRGKRENPYFFDSYMANAFPTYFFVDDHGIIRHIQIGHSDDLEQSFAKVIERLTKTMGTGASGTR